MSRDLRRRRRPRPMALETLEPRMVLSATPQNLLVSSTWEHRILEFTPSGTLEQTLDVPRLDDGGRDLVQDASGKVHVFNGTFNPYLSSYDPETSSWSHLKHPGWSTVGNLTYGGIDVKGSYVFVTDASSYNAEEKGLVRFDMTTGLSQRFADEFEFKDLDVGLDGLLYGLSGSTLYVYDPASLELSRVVQLPLYSDDSREIAVDSNGDLFVGTINNQILRYDPSGTEVLDSMVLYNGLYDMDLADDGRIATAAWGTVTLTDRSLDWQSSFSTYGGPSFVAFGSLPTPLTAGGPYFTVEGVAVTLNGSGAYGPDDDPSTLTFEWDLDYDGSSFQADATGISPTVSYPENMPIRTIALRVTDADGAERLLTTTLEVASAPPTLTSLTTNATWPDGGVNEGQVVTVSADFYDLGVLDTVTATINWGDGSAPQTFTYGAGTTSLTEGHVYRDGGNYDISVSLNDDDGAYGNTLYVRAVVAGARLNGTTLEIYGTQGADTVTIARVNDTTARVTGSFISGEKIYDLVWVDQIRVMLGGGDDRATMASGITKSALFDGGAGKDVISGGGGPNILLGGDGDDQLTGGSGRDLIIGGNGADKVTGGAGEDIVIGGRTEYDPYYDTLFYLMNDWNGPGDFWTRTARLRYSLSNSTVYDDGVRDDLNGGDGLDWFFAGTNDRTDRRKGE